MEAHLIGEIAALGTAGLWTTCSILFAAAGRRIGALSVNAFRIVVAVLLLAGAHLLAQGTLLPRANAAQWFFLALSGVVGLALGDFCYFKTLVLLGPRRGVLLMSTAPIFAALAAYFVLSEIPGLWAIVGIATTLAGVAIVVLESEEASGERRASQEHKTLGVFLGLGGALGQGLGLVISKYGMITAADDPDLPLDPLSVTLIRMLAAAAVVWLAIAFSGKSACVLNSYRDKGAIVRTVGGAASGPFLGVWLSMVAICYTAAGIAATLMAVMPVMVIPFVWFLYRQRTSGRGVLGAIITVIGVAILFLL